MDVEALRFVGVLAFAGALVFWLSRNRREMKRLSFRYAWRSMCNTRWREWGRVFSFATAFIIIGLLWIPVVASLTTFTTGHPLTRSEVHPVTQTAAFSVPLAFFLMGTLPILEEFLWRGIVLRRLRRRIHTLNAVIVSSFGFGLAHLLNAGTYFWAFVPPVVGGLIFSCAYLAGGLKCSIITHSGYNLVALGLIFL